LQQEWAAGKAALQEHPLAGCNCKANAASGLIIAATPRGCDHVPVFHRYSLGQDRKGIATSLHALKNRHMIFSRHHGISSGFPKGKSV